MKEYLKLMANKQVKLVHGTRLIVYGLPSTVKAVVCRLKAVDLVLCTSNTVPIEE